MEYTRYYLAPPSILQILFKYQSILITLGITILSSKVRIWNSNIIA